jgi:hypothetical protein
MNTMVAGWIVAVLILVILGLLLAIGALQCRIRGRKYYAGVLQLGSAFPIAVAGVITGVYLVQLTYAASGYSETWRGAYWILAGLIGVAVGWIVNSVIVNVPETK